MSELAREVEPESGKESFTSGRACPDCDETVREAKLIQTSLLPTQGFRNESVDIAFRFIPFSDVGGRLCRLLPFTGRFHRHLPRGRGRERLVGGHVCRTRDGNPARGIHKTGTDTARVLTLLNERLVQRPIRGRFCSTLYALFNPTTRELIFSNAGMPLPLLVSGTACRQLGEGGLPSGMFPGSTYGRHVVQLAPGDSILFATDGLHELCNGEGVEFCTAQMGEVWAQCRHKSATESADFVFDRQVAFSDGSLPHDDISVVVLKVLA